MDSTRQEVVITRFKIGHSFLTHSHLISKDPPPTCNECLIDLTVQHIIQDCTKYQVIRNQLKIPPNMEEALDENNTHTMRLITLTGGKVISMEQAMSDEEFDDLDPSNICSSQVSRHCIDERNHALI
ncbi:Hypothetical protein CINCED_3A021348 [Cinara cedri]|uniref:Uncharacterized protein n=1 Tax=Cinara cedri TaxID=506608 RepID=A0A5E4NQH0_9HEMI|nr:Hypothetical protein CINCED_3A021348 [Cinara cedri]